jgi:hypothetical protein
MLHHQQFLLLHRQHTNQNHLTIPISRVFVVPALKAVITKTFISTSCEFAGITIDKDLSVVLPNAIVSV